MEENPITFDTSRPPKKRPAPRLRGTVTKDERRTILQAVEEAKRDLMEYDVEINRLKAVIILAESKRNRLSTLIAKYRASLSPVHRLPSEILAEIFKAYCGGGGRLNPKRKPSMVVLSMVCGRWREIALSTATLWSFMEIHLGCWTTMEEGKLLRTTQLFISRSERHPLKISIIFHSINLSHLTVNVVDLLVKSCDRWHDVSLVLSRVLTGHSTFQNIRGKTPLLEKLSLSCIDGPPADEFLGIFRDAPALHTVHLRNFYMVSPQVVLPSQQIISLSLAGSFDSNIMSVLPFFPSVNEIKITIPGGDDGDASEVFGSLVLSNARSLTISFDVFCDRLDRLDRLFNFLQLPNLHTIHIQYDSLDTEPWDIIPMRECLIRLSCVLTSLHLHGLPMSDEHMLSLLRLMPCLEILHVEEPSVPSRSRSSLQNMIITSSFLEQLVINPELQDWEPAKAIIPRLKHLTLRLYSPSLDQKALVDVITSRWIPNEGITLGEIYCLRRVSLVIDVPDEDSTLDDEVTLGTLLPLKYLKDVGLGISIKIEQYSQYCT